LILAASPVSAPRPPFLLPAASLGSNCSRQLWPTKWRMSRAQTLRLYPGKSQEQEFAVKCPADRFRQLLTEKGEPFRSPSEKGNGTVLEQGAALSLRIDYLDRNVINYCDHSQQTSISLTGGISGPSRFARSRRRPTLYVPSRHAPNRYLRSRLRISIALAQKDLILVTFDRTSG